MSGQICKLQPLLAQPASGWNHTDNPGAIAHALPALPSGLPEIDSNDAVIRSPFQALTGAMHGNDRECAEALRLAIAGEHLGLRPSRHGAAASNRARAGDRRIQALQKWRLRHVIDHIDAHLSSKVTLCDLAAVAGLSRMHFASQFRVATGLRPHEFLLRRRVRRAEELMRNTSMTIVEIALTVGFQTQAHFTTVFKRFAGCTPRRWRTINQPPRRPGPNRLSPSSFEDHA